MANAHARVNIGTQRYKTDVSIRQFNFVIDEPPEADGQDLGPTPAEYLAAALGGCTAVTMKMYAQRKGWDLQNVEVKVDVDWRANPQHVARQITMSGNLTQEQRDRLRQIADACPVHKLLQNPITVETTLA